MKEYCKNDFFTLYQGNMLDMLDVIDPCSIDSIITDPPYELGFMGKGWDSSGIAFQKETWEKCFSVLKSGGYLLAFGGSRTFHRIACAIEDAGFEIRDCIMWLYGTGFPKSMNIGLAIDKKSGMESNEWNGWGTALKPAYEPIIVARKPVEKSCVENVLKYGVGGINIEECKIGNDVVKTQGGNKFNNLYGNFNECKESEHAGRFPSNVILTYDETDFDEVCGEMPINNGNSVARYFYCAKASSKDRDEGLDSFESKKRTDGNIRTNQETARIFGANSAVSKNTHPTVKPTELMQYLVRLVNPKGATILDCFNGSGSTGKAVLLENVERKKEYKYIGIELTEEYLPIAEARLKWIIKEKELKQNNSQMSIFDLQSKMP